MQDLGGTSNTKERLLEDLSVSPQKPRTVKSQLLVSPFQKRCHWSHISKKTNQTNLSKKPLYFVGNLEGRKTRKGASKLLKLSKQHKLELPEVSLDMLTMNLPISLAKPNPTHWYKFNNLTFHSIITDSALVLPLFFPNSIRRMKGRPKMRQ